MREPSRLSGSLIARKGRAWPGEFAEDAASRGGDAARPRRRAAIAFGFGIGAFALAAGSGVLGYRVGVEQASRQAPALAALEAPPRPAPAEAPDLSLPTMPLKVAASRPPPLPAEAVPAPSAVEAPGGPPIVEEPGGLGTPAKPAGTYAVPPAPPEEGAGGAAAWVDVAAALDSMAATAAAGSADPAPLPRRKPAEPTGVRVQLSALGSEAAARREWQRLKRSHGALLDGRRPIFVRGHPRGTAQPVYRLQLASFASRDAARSFCEQARSRNLGCIIVR